MQIQQRIVRSIGVALLISATALVSGCASIVHSGSRTITINSQPSNAKVTVTKSGTQEIVHSGTTPLTTVLDPKRGYFTGQTFLVRLELPGFETDEVLIKPELSGWYFGNIVFGGLIGMVAVDPATGSMWNLVPDKLERTLAPRGPDIARSEAATSQSFPVSGASPPVAVASDPVVPITPQRAPVVATPAANAQVAASPDPRSRASLSPIESPPAPLRAAEKPSEPARASRATNATLTANTKHEALAQLDDRASALGLLVYVLSGEIWVKSVAPRSAASAAGIREGDTIVSFNSEKYRGDGFTLLRKINSLAESAQGFANVTWRRQGSLEEISRRLSWARD